jgi:hypothetical protein
MINPFRWWISQPYRGNKPLDKVYATLVILGMAVPVLTLLWRLVLAMV